MGMEIWQAIPSIPHYEASDLGRVRRIAPGRGARVDRILTLRALPTGYLLATLNMDGKAYIRLVHRLVAEAFLGTCPDGREVNHRDSDKTNNRPSNLEYVTRSENLLHAVENTGAYRGERNSAAVVTEPIVREIRAMHAAGAGYKRLAKHFGLTWGCVRSIATRKTWAWLE